MKRKVMVLATLAFATAGCSSDAQDAQPEGPSGEAPSAEEIAAAAAERQAELDAVERPRAEQPMARRAHLDRDP